MSLAVPQQQQVIEAPEIGLSRLGKQWDVKTFHLVYYASLPESN